MAAVGPPAARAELARLKESLEAILAESLLGLYVHGSLALECFNVATSDLDVLAVTRRALADDEKLALVEVFLRLSRDPYPIEADVLTLEQLRHWQHPSPFELHYSEWRRERWLSDPRGTLTSFPRANADLAAHVPVARAAGIALAGPAPSEVFPRVPGADVRDSLLRDLEWCRELPPDDPYAVLSPCRIWAALETGELHSKLSGAQWALFRLPDDLRPLAERALATYTGAGERFDVDGEQRKQLLDFVEERLRR